MVTAAIFCIYGLSFFALGIVSAALTIGKPVSWPRNRLLGLAAFGLIHAAYEWMQLASLMGAHIPETLSMGIAAASFLPLFWFALARHKAGARLSVVIAGLAAILWIFASVLLSQPGALEALTRIGIGCPAALTAAASILQGGSLRTNRGKTAWPLRLLAACLAGYGATQLVLPADSGLTGAFTASGFEDVFGMPIYAFRALFAVLITGGVIASVGTVDGTLRKTLESQLARSHGAFQASEARFRALFESGPECVWVLAPDTGLVDLNSAGLQLLEADSKDAILGRSALDVVDPAHHGQFKKMVDDVFRGHAASLQFETVGLKGTRRWMYQWAVPLFDSEGTGRIVAMLGINRDQTERICTEAALRATARQLQEAQRVAQIGSWELDLTQNTLIWSEEIYRMFEIDPARFGATYEAFLNAIHPEDREAVDKAYKNSLANKTPYEIVHRLMMADGRIKWVFERCETEFDASGTPLVSRGTVQDITKRKLDEDALRQSETMLTTFLRVSPEAVIVTDAQTRITVFSAGAESIFGYSADEVTGRPVEDLIPQRLRKAHQSHVAHYSGSSAPGRTMNDRGGIIGLRKNGEEFPARASLSKLETPGGVFFASILRDISQETAAREALIQAQRAAESSSEAKSRFIANMSHELRTPLNAIIGFSEYMMSPSSSALGENQVREFAKDIHESGRRLLKIINNILEFSKMDAAGMELEEERVSALDLIGSCTRMAVGPAEEAGVSIMVDASPFLPEISADSGRLSKAVLNLVSNAVKFTEPGGHVIVGARLAGCGSLDIFVQDTGIGMSSDAIARIGEPFMQADNRLSRRFDGVGLGLTIVKRIAELHGGALLFESALGKGTVATLRLPAERLDSARAASGPIRTQPPPPTHTHHRLKV